MTERIHLIVDCARQTVCIVLLRVPYSIRGDVKAIFRDNYNSLKLPRPSPLAEGHRPI